MTNSTLRTPVAFIIFNRPEVTQRVFAEIAKAQPPKLLVVGDGPRKARAGEAERVAAARDIIRQVDWPCDVLCNYSDINLGCKARVSSGLDWVFEQVPEAIILEDDCLPDQSFFRFCEDLLDRYRADQRIGMISGDNFQFGREYNEDSYYFSKYTHIWGWASWRDRWVKEYDVDIKTWPKIRDASTLANFLEDQKEVAFWSALFDKAYLKQIDTWDYQWTLTNWSKGRLTILPSVNLISNIGFSADATHTVSASRFANLPVRSIDFPLRHPTEVIQNRTADDFTKRDWFLTPLWKKIFNRLQVLSKRWFHSAG
jgi:hypothetical protein